MKRRSLTPGRPAPGYPRAWTVQHSSTTGPRRGGPSRDNASAAPRPACRAGVTFRRNTVGVQRFAGGTSRRPPSGRPLGALPDADVSPQGLKVAVPIFSDRGSVGLDLETVESGEPPEAGQLKARYLMASAARSAAHSRLQAGPVPPRARGAFSWRSRRRPNLDALRRRLVRAHPAGASGAVAVDTPYLRRRPTGRASAASLFLTVHRSGRGCCGRGPAPPRGGVP